MPNRNKNSAPATNRFKLSIILATAICVVSAGIFFVLFSQRDEGNTTPITHEYAQDTPVNHNGNIQPEETDTTPTSAEVIIMFDTQYLFVATTGSDRNDGSKENPFATIQQAISVASARRYQGAQTIYIREGMYFQQAIVFDSRHDPTGRDRASGTEPAFLTIRNYPGETAVIDGSLNVVVDQGQHQMIVVRNSDYVKIYGLTIQNNAPTNLGFSTPAAVLVETAGAQGRSQGVQIINNTILGMDGDTFGMPTPVAPGANGSAIQVYGRTQLDENSLRYVLIHGNEIGYSRVGWTENIVIGGNVSDFAITNNFVHNTNNIGINVIGLWGWITNTGTSADARSDWNRARRGIVQGNVVINNIGYSNHASEGCGGASGIYVDGAMDIDIRYNFVSGSSVGISVGTEPPHARWYGQEPVMAENVRIHHNIIANNRQGAVLIGGTFGSWDLDLRNNTMIGRDIVPGASGGVNGVVNINNNWTGREMNRNFHFEDNIIVSFVDYGVDVSVPGHVIHFLNSGWNDSDGDNTRAAYTTFTGNVIYGRLPANNLPDASDALPFTNLQGQNIRATSSPLAGMNFASGIDTGDFTRTQYADGAGADIELIMAAMADARLPLFDIAMADYRGFVNTLPQANAIMRHLSSPAVRGSLDAPIPLSRVGRNIARYFEEQIQSMPATAALPEDSPQRHAARVGILNWAFGYEPDAAGYGGRLSVQQGFFSDEAYRGIISFGYGNEGDIDFSRVAALQSPWTIGSERDGGGNARYPSLRFFVQIPYYNEAAGRTSYIVRGFHTPSWWRGIAEAGAIIEISQMDIIDARRNNPMRRYVCATTGSNENNGTQAHPWATVNHALSQVWHGDTISLRGTFTENVIVPISASGNRNNPTTITNWRGYEATIEGTHGEFAIYMRGVDNITIDGVQTAGTASKIFIGHALERRELRNFQSNMWDVHSLGRDDENRDEIYGMFMLRDIVITNTNAAVEIEESNRYAPFLGLRVDNNLD